MTISVSRRALFAIAAGGIAGAALPAFADPRPPWGTRTRLPLSLLLPLIDGAFAGTTLRLHNYGPRHGNSWHAPLASSLALGARLGGRSQAFTIDEFRNGSFRYYVNDINMSRLAFSRAGGAIRLTLDFESRGTELKGRCAGGVFRCPVGSDDTAPDIQINGGSVTLDLFPAAHGNSVAFNRVTSAFNGRIQAGGICRSFGDLCDRFTHYKARIRDAIQGAAGSMLAGATVKDLLATRLRPELDRAGVGNVVSAFLEGDNLVVIHRRA